MFFEGSEKKLELVIKRDSTSLRSYELEFWKKIVGKSQAQILSTIENDDCTAFLLSESSLFVFNHSLVMLTCGQTSLADAALELLKNIPRDDIEAFFFERKHEVFPRKQPTTFFNDIEKLKTEINGLGYRFGNEDEHHLYLYHMDKEYTPEKNDLTLEILMHGVEDAEKLFQKETVQSQMGKDNFYKRTQIDKILPEFTVDDHFFEPHGYSLNAIRKEEYYTIHVTPQEIGAYVSFESNYNHHQEGNLQETIEKVLEIFQPSSFDIVLFEPHILKPIRFSKYQLKGEIIESIPCGYNVGYFSYFLPQTEPKKAFKLNI